MTLCLIYSSTRNLFQPTFFWVERWATDQSFIWKEITSYKIHTLGRQWNLGPKSTTGGLYCSARDTPERGSRRRAGRRPGVGLTFFGPSLVTNEQFQSSNKRLQGSAFCRHVGKGQQFSSFIKLNWERFLGKLLSSSWERFSVNNYCTSWQGLSPVSLNKY